MLGGPPSQMVNGCQTEIDPCAGVLARQLKEGVTVIESGGQNVCVCV